MPAHTGGMTFGRRIPFPVSEIRKIEVQRTYLPHSSHEMPVAIRNGTRIPGSHFLTPNHPSIQQCRCELQHYAILAAGSRSGSSLSLSTGFHFPLGYGLHEACCCLAQTVSSFSASPSKFPKMLQHKAEGADGTWP